MGICGEKLVALADGSLSYLSITSNGSSGDPALATFSIVYNNLLVDENAAGENIINYTVALTEYADVLQPTSGSFTFEIEKTNTCAKTQLVEHQTINDFYKIRIEEPRILSF